MNLQIYAYYKNLKNYIHLLLLFAAGGLESFAEVSRYVIKVSRPLITNHICNNTDMKLIIVVTFAVSTGPINEP